MTANIRPLVRLSPAQIIAGGGQEDMDYMLDRPPFTRYYWSGAEFLMNGGIDSTHTAAQLTALADAGGLTPYATYIASDDPYPQWALDAYTLGSPLGGNYVNVQVATAGGGTIEV